MFEAVWVSTFFATEVDEEVRGSVGVLGDHVPHDPERVAGHLTDLDVAGGGERRFHSCHLQPNRGMEKSRE